MQIIPPVFERELRVAARRRGTFWTRAIVASLATLVGAWLLLTMQWSYVRQPAEISQAVFSMVSGLAAIYCLLAGLLNTADCISSEKREGTLGLLFLTDLKGYSVVGGKMLATSLNSFYALMAIFPVLAIPLLLGGIPPEVFWEMTAFLVNLLFFSLSAGMLMSVLGREERRTVGWTLLLVLFFTGGIPLLGLVGTDLWHRFLTPGQSYDMFSQRPPVWTLWPSPVYGFVTLMTQMFGGGAGRGFWASWLTLHACAWSFLALASARLPYSWQDRALSAARLKLRERLTRWTHGSAGSRAYFRRRLLDVNAFFWLAARNRFKPLAVWVVLAATGLFWAWGWWKWPSDFTDEWVFVLIVLWLHTVLKLWVASESCQRVAEDRQSGALELLLSTPLSVRDILRGQWLALRRQFLWPTLAVAALDVYLALRLGTSRNNHYFLYLGGAGLVVFLADLATLAWVGMWLGLLKRNASKALLGAIGRVLILPWVLYAVLGQIVSILSFRWVWFRSSSAGELALWVSVGLALDWFLLFLARYQLLRRFRELATQRADVKTRRWWWPFGKGKPSPPVPTS